MCQQISDHNNITVKKTHYNCGAGAAYMWEGCDGCGWQNLWHIPITNPIIIENTQDFQQKHCVNTFVHLSSNSRDLLDSYLADINVEATRENTVSYSRYFIILIINCHWPLQKYYIHLSINCLYKGMELL